MFSVFFYSQVWKKYNAFIIYQKKNDIYTNFDYLCRFLENGSNDLDVFIMKGLDDVLKNLSNYRSNYDDSKFWKKIKSIAAKASSKVIYYALLLFYTLKSSDVSFHNKALICGALGYFILPIDLIPDMLIPVGYTDDIAVILYMIRIIKNEITPEIENKAKEKLTDLGLHFDETI